MNFKRGKHREEPEINFIALIDVMMVILIFLMVSTTYTRFSELKINLPSADAEKASDKPKEISIAVDAQGKYVVNNTPVVFSGVEGFSVELRKAAGDVAEPVVVINADAAASHQSVINADAAASHQSVINVMEGARLAGFNRITFATQAKPGK